MKTEKEKSRPQRAAQATQVRFWNKQTTPLLVLFALGFFLYAYTFSFQYALDDKLYITDNQFTKKGFAGIPDILSQESLVGFWGQKKDLLEGGRYRPLGIVTFAIEIGLWGEKPGISHFFNVILYCLAGLLLFRILFLLFPPKENTPWYLTLPFITTALFMAHPLHTEVVANIKGRIEILESVGVLLTLYCALKYLQKESYGWLAAIFGAFFMALMSKESAVTFLAIIPLTLYFFTKAPVRQHLLVLAPLTAATVLFLAIRQAVVGYFIGSDKVVIDELLNDPFLGSSIPDKFATIFYTMGLYIKLLFLPVTLTHDYYPKQIPIIGWSNPGAFLSLLLYVVLGLYALWGLVKKQVPAYGIWVYLLSFSVVSNLVFPIGTFMNERFMYLPSIGFCLIAGWWLTEVLPKYLKPVNLQKTLTAVFGVLLVLYSVRTLARLPAWYDNETLFLTDVNNSPNSTKVNTSAGGTLVEKAAKLPKTNPDRNPMLIKGIGYLDKALQIYPTNYNALLLRGNAHYELNADYDKMFESYVKLLENNPDHPQVLQNLGMMSETENDPKNVDKLIGFIEQKALPLGPSSAIPYSALGKMYGKKKNDLDKAIFYFEKALAIDPANATVLQDITTAYGMKGKYAEAVEMGKRALEKDPNNAKTNMNIGISYQNMGDTANARRYLERAFMLDPKLKGGN
ncbi:tetratricopeptide repeat protein [Sphingobacteriales bacterium UPWRP_1]|nr:hypothetical protein BVG80_05200 [Sphingobacteriales bacterium TSM_CSM]PSJ76267.1 tetratricopeptide repeat protein [Sphingobacteriales bacterium UPWRP_1]